MRNEVAGSLKWREQIWLGTFGIRVSRSYRHNGQMIAGIAARSYLTAKTTPTVFQLEQMGRFCPPAPSDRRQNLKRAALARVS